MHQRLFQTVYLLTENDNLTATQLAERFGVSKRTVYRDIDALSAAGVPVYTEPGRGGGIRLLPGYVVDKSMFTEEEQAQLLTGFESLAAIGTPGGQDLSEKLAAMFGKRESWLEVNLLPWAGGEAAQRLFDALRDAILQRQAVQFLYLGANGKATRRTVEPVRILFKSYGWYLSAWCRERQDFRLFKLTRVQEFSLLGEYFAPRTPPRLEDTYDTGAPVVEFTLRIAASSGFRVYDEFPWGLVQPQEDGSFIVQCQYLNDDWVLGQLLSYGADLEVLAPQEMREKMKKIYEINYKKYSE